MVLEVFFDFIKAILSKFIAEFLYKFFNKGRDMGKGKRVTIVANNPEDIKDWGDDSTVVCLADANNNVIFNKDEIAIGAYAKAGKGSIAIGFKAGAGKPSRERNKK